MDAKGIVDALPWMLVESTGDSEIDARIGRASDFNDNDDDAESCTCDESVDFDSDNLRDLRRRFDAVDDQDRKDEKARVYVQEEVRGHRRNYGGGDEQKGLPILCHKSSASIDSTEEEKNKLFWEACLAS